MRVRSALLVVGLLAAAHSHAASAAPEVPIPIGIARLLPVGTHVTVLGTVSTPSGAFNSSFGDNGFGLEDLFAGIYISIQDNPSVAPPQLATVTGTLADQSGLLVIIPDDDAAVATFGRGLPVVPRRVRTVDVDAQTQGLIVQVHGTIVDGPNDDAPYGFKFLVDDGSGPISIYINTATDIAMSSLALGDEVRITGFSSYYVDHDEIDPATHGDVVVLP